MVAEFQVDENQTGPQGEKQRGGGEREEDAKRESSYVQTFRLVLLVLCWLLVRVDLSYQQFQP